MAVSQVAAAVSAVAKVAYEILHKDQRELIDDAFEKARADVESFKQALLAKDWVTVQLKLNGLMFGIHADITSRDFEQLRTTPVDFDAYDILGLYARARGAEFAQRVCQIVQTAEGS